MRAVAPPLHCGRGSLNPHSPWRIRMSSAIPNLGAIDPIGLIIDVGAGVLGLPPEVKNIAKIAVGIAMANPVTALNGATGLLGNLEERAATEWKPPPEG